jgi:acetyl esterase/lipase
MPAQRPLEDAPLPTLISIPDHDAATAPVMVFLHGYDEGAPTPLAQGVTRHGPLAATAAAVAPARRFLIVAPQLGSCGDTWHRHARDVRAILDRVLGEHGGDADRVYLTGFSFGGNGVLDLALLLRDRLAALWAVDPTRVPSIDTNLPLWLSAGQITRRQERGFLRVLRLERDGVAGDRVYVDEGLDHVGTATSAFRNAMIYDWLLARRRSE